MKKSVTTELIPYLDTASDLEARRIITELLKVGKRAVPELLVAAQNSKKPRIRKWSLLALGEIGDKRAAFVLIAALKEKPMTVRLYATRGLGAMRYRPAVKRLIPLLKDESGGIRANALTALASIGDKSFLPHAVKLLSDTQWYVRALVIGICGDFEYKRAVVKIAELEHSDPHKSVRRAAVKALNILS